MAKGFAMLIRLFCLHHEVSVVSRQISTALLLGLCLLTPVVNAVTASENVVSYDLDRAVEIALENNRLRTISQQSLAVAEAQYREAASSYWPSLNLNVGFQRRDETAIYEYPERTFDAAPGMLPPITMPAQDVPLLGRDTTLYSLEMSYPLYTGGKRSSLVEQARIGVDIAGKEVRRTDLQVVQDVKRYFYAALYTQQLADLADDISLSFEVLRDITKAFYEGGSNSVDKLDLLRSELAYTMAASTFAELKAKHDSALAALSFAMGLDWRDRIKLEDSAYPSEVDPTSLDRLIEQALSFNPDVEKLALVVDVYEAKIDEARSGYRPTLALIGSYDGFNNDLNGGLDNEFNRRSWQIGIGMQLSLFDGGRTKHSVSAAKVERDKMEQQRLLTSEAVATQVKNLFLQTKAAQEQVTITQQAIATSRENRDLTTRAYHTGAVDTQKVIEANLFDAMIRSNLYRAMHDRALYLAEISYLLGREASE